MRDPRSSAIRRGISGVLLLCALQCAAAAASSDKLKLYDGPPLPPSQLVTLLVRGDQWPITLDISIPGKKNTRVHNGAQVLPGTYRVSVLSMCGVPQKYPPTNPPPGTMFSVYEDSFTASAGETVQFVVESVDYPVISMNRRGHEYPLTPGSTCYGAWGVWHTVMKSDVPEPDAENNGPFRFPAMEPVMKYLEAQGRGDQQAAAALLAQDAAGDLSRIFQKDKDSGWAFSASNTKFWELAYKTIPDLHGKPRAVPQDAGQDQIVAEVDFRKSPLELHSYLVVFSLVQENGAWKIAKIAEWWNPQAPVK